MIIDGREIFDQKKIANCFNNFFADIGPKLASMISESQAKLDRYLNPHQTFMGEVNLTDDEVKEALRSLKPIKSLGFDNISSNVVNETSHIFFTPLEINFQSFVTTGNISRKLKNCEDTLNL